MKKTQLYGLILLITTLGAVLSVGFVSASIPDYFPKADDVEGYDLLWENIIEVSNPLNASAANISAGAQIWTKNDTENNVVAVVGVLVVKFSEDVFGKRLPRLIKTLLVLYNDSYSDINTYWDLLVEIAVQSPKVEDISDSINTVEGALAYTDTDEYLILSKDAEFLIFSFGFHISNAWYSFVLAHQTEVEVIFNFRMEIIATVLVIFQTIVEIIDGFGDGIIPIPEASADGEMLDQPIGSTTSVADVQYVTNQIGKLYGSSNLLWIIIGVVGAAVVLGGLVIVVRRRK